MVGTLRRGFQALLVVDMVLAAQECRFAKHSLILHVWFVCVRHISVRQQDRDREQGWGERGRQAAVQDWLQGAGAAWLRASDGGE